MKKPVFFVLMAIFGVVALALLAFFLFGYIEMNNECKFKGPMASVGEGACSKNVNGSGYEYEGRYKDDLEFNIPTNYYLNEEVEENEDAEITFIFSKNPEEVEDGEFAANLNIIKSRDYIEFNDQVCEDLMTSSIEQLTQYYETLGDGEAQIEDIGGINTCVNQWQGTLSGIDLFQKQFAVAHKDSQVVYYFTVTTNQALDELSTLEGMVYGLKLR
jgi:hypothetical protein